MSIAVTRAAVEMEERAEDLSPYEVISLLFDGALERIDQAQVSLSTGQPTETDALITKVVGIVNGLRNSLDLEKGGEIAENLDNLYEYMDGRLKLAHEDRSGEILQETGKLLAELRDGWEGMSVA